MEFQCRLFSSIMGLSWGCRYARCANKEYALTAGNQCDFETHFTVVCYDDDQDVAQSQVLPPAYIE